MDDGPAQVEIAQQHRALGQVGLRQRQVDGGEGLAFGRRRAGDDDGVQRLQGLQVVQPRAQRAELFGRRFVRVVQIQQVRFRAPAENGTTCTSLQHAGVDVEPQRRHRRRPSRRRSPVRRRGRRSGLQRAGFRGNRARGSSGGIMPPIFRPPQCIVYSTHGFSPARRVRDSGHVYVLCQSSSNRSPLITMDPKIIALDQASQNRRRLRRTSSAFSSSGMLLSTGRLV